MSRALGIDGRSLTLERFHDVVLEGRECVLDERAAARVLAARRTVESTLARDEAVYGVNTGFGDLANVGIETGSEIQSK